ncbi:MAG: DUF2868 domain-containing protein [Planctomycetota bacterium]
MREEQLKQALLIQAFEEADGKGTLLPAHERAEAASRARSECVQPGESGEDAGEAVIARRAQLLYERLAKRVPFLDRALSARRLGGWVVPLVLVIALMAGMLVNALGPSRHINVLSFPLLGLVLWNLGVYVFGSWRWVQEWRKDRPAPGARPAVSATPISGFLSWLQDWLWSRTWTRRAAESQVLATALSRYQELWGNRAGKLLEARLWRLLHLGSLALVLGVVTGMYLRGLAFRYHATWESTFLSVDSATSLVNLFLGPAAAVLGVEVPALAKLQGESGDAATWIHLYAMTALMFVIVPRAALTVVESVRCQRLVASLCLPLEEDYYRRLLSPGRGQGTRVDVIPYSYHLSKRYCDSLKAILHDMVGSRAEIRIAETVEYGAERDDIQDALKRSQEPPGEWCIATIFSLGQSPEIEVHGRFLEDLKGCVAGQGRVLTLVDASGFRQRLGDSGITEKRLEERQRTWDRVAHDAELQAVHFDLEHPPGVDLLARMGAALWPAEKTTVV